MAPSELVNDVGGEGSGGDASAGDVDVVPAPSIADVDACRYTAWHSRGSLAEHTFKSVTIPLPSDFVAYLLADGLILAADSEAMPARVTPDVAEQMESGFNRSDEEEDDGKEKAEAAEGVAVGPGVSRVGGGDDDSFEALKARFGGGGGRAGSDEDASSSSSSSSDDDEAVGVGEARTFPELEAALRAAIAELGGAVLPKLTWSAPKDAVWMATTNTMRCCNPGEVILLLKASDAVAHDLQDAYAQCSDYRREGRRGDGAGGGDSGGGGASGGGGGGGGGGDEDGARERLTTGVTLTLRKWFDLSPSMEFRCFVKSGHLRGICQRDVSNFYPYLLDEVEALEELLAAFWQDHVSGAFPSPDYVFDVYVTSRRRCRLVDFNPWGGATLPLLFDWHELSQTPDRPGGYGGGGGGYGDGGGIGGGSYGQTVRGGGGYGGDVGYTDDLEFRVVRSQGHIRPGLQLGVPFDMYDRAPDGALANFVEQQRRRQEAAAAARE